MYLYNAALSLPNYFCMKMGSDVSHMSTHMHTREHIHTHMQTHARARAHTHTHTHRGKVTRQCPYSTMVEETGEPKRLRNRIEPMSSAYQPIALPLGQTSSFSRHCPSACPSLFNRYIYIYIYLYVVLHSSFPGSLDRLTWVKLQYEKLLQFVPNMSTRHPRT